MSLLEKIKKDQLQARKDRNSVKASLLTTLLGALNTKSAGTNASLTDAEVVAEVKKFLKNAQETRGHLEASTADVGLQLEEINREIEVLMELLPVQLSADMLETAIKNMVSDMTIDNGVKPQMGQVMGELKRKYDGQYDGALASKLVKAALQ